jgi:tetratricopeptide (TPR) repeat protein
MKLYLLLALALMSLANTAGAVGTLGANAFGDPAEKALSSVQAGAIAARKLALIGDVLGYRLRVSCNKCRAGYALKVVEQTIKKQSVLGTKQLAEAEQLRSQGQALYDEGKFKESLELLQQAEAILGIDASGDPLPPAKQSSGAAEQPVTSR